MTAPLIDRALALAAETLEEAFQSHDTDWPCPMMPCDFVEALEAVKAAQAERPYRQPQRTSSAPLSRPGEPVEAGGLPGGGKFVWFRHVSGAESLGLVVGEDNGDLLIEQFGDRRTYARKPREVVAASREEVAASFGGQLRTHPEARNWPGRDKFEKAFRNMAESAAERAAAHRPGPDDEPWVELGSTIPPTLNRGHPIDDADLGRYRGERKKT